jgi:hypothetical protein
MALMHGKLYDALRAGGVPDAKAIPDEMAPPRITALARSSGENCSRP